MPYVSLDDVFVELDDFSDADLIAELEDRGYEVGQKIIEADDLPEVEAIVQMHRCGNPDWESAALQLLYRAAGRIV
jgi:hypothetical protein